MLDDMKIMKMIEKKTQRDLIAMILMDYLEKNREKIDTVKKLLK